MGRGWGGAAAQSRAQQRGARGADGAAAAAGVKKGVPGGDPAPVASLEGTAELASLFVLTLGACC